MPISLCLWNWQEHIWNYSYKTRSWGQRFRVRSRWEELLRGPGGQHALWCPNRHHREPFALSASDKEMAPLVEGNRHQNLGEWSFLWTWQWLATIAPEGTLRVSCKIAILYLCMGVLSTLHNRCSEWKGKGSQCSASASWLSSEGLLKTKPYSELPLKFWLSRSWGRGDIYSKNNFPGEGDALGLETVASFLAELSLNNQASK